MNFKFGAMLAAAAAIAGAGVTVVAQTVTIDVAAIVSSALPYLSELVTAAVIGFIGFVAEAFRRKTNIDMSATLLAIEAKHREAYQSALTNAAGRLAERVGTNGKVEIDLKNPLAGAALKIAVDMVKRSVPDAVNKFGLHDDAVIAEGVLAKLPQVAPGVTVTEKSDG